MCKILKLLKFCTLYWGEVVTKSVCEIRITAIDLNYLSTWQKQYKYLLNDKTQRKRRI